MSDMTLHSRQKKILALLNTRHGIVTGSEISEALMVTERTVRSDISGINNQLQSFGIKILSVRGKGYSISIRNRRTFLELFSGQENFLTREDRSEALLKKLFQSDSWLNMETVEDEMFISHTTLENDIKYIRSKLSSAYPYIRLEKNYNFIKLEEDEAKRRSLLIQLYLRNWDFDSREGIILKNNPFDEVIFREIQNKTRLFLFQNNLLPEDIKYIYLVLSIMIMFIRTSEGRYIKILNRNSFKNNSADIDDFRLFSDVKKLIDDILKITQNYYEIPEYEYLWIYGIVTGLISDSHSEPEALKMSTEVLREIDTVYGLTFSEDETLSSKLASHIDTIMKGLIPPQLQNHKNETELRKNHPFLSDISHFTRISLEKKCGLLLGDEEDIFLLPYFIISEDLLFSKNKKSGARAVLISHMNDSMTSLLLNRLKKLYGHIFDIYGAYPLFAAGTAAETHPELAFSTVRLQNFKKETDVPVIIISPTLNENDTGKINRFIRGIKGRYLYQNPPHNMSWYFPENQRIKLVKSESVPTSLNRSHRSGSCTVLDNDTVFAYSFNTYASKSSGWLIVSEKPVMWDRGVKAHNIIYMSLNPYDSKYLGWFYYIAHSFSDNPSLLLSVVNGTSLEDLDINISRRKFE